MYELERPVIKSWRTSWLFVPYCMYWQDTYQHVRAKRQREQPNSGTKFPQPIPRSLQCASIDGGSDGKVEENAMARDRNFRFLTRVQLWYLSTCKNTKCTSYQVSKLWETSFVQHGNVLLYCGYSRRYGVTSVWSTVTRSALSCIS